MRYDLVIIGAGAVGCAIAWELSKYKLKTAVVEKEWDLAFGISGRNSGVVHAGFNNPVASMKARFCVEGKSGFEKLAEELKIQYRKTGKLVTGFSDEDRLKIESLKERGERNGLKGLRIINEKEIKELNPLIEGRFALFSPETAIFDPFEYTIALGESAAANGTEFFFGKEVVSIKKVGNNPEHEEIGEIFELKLKDNTDGVMPKEPNNTSLIFADMVINAAGLFADEICEMVGIDEYKITPCRGEYHVLERSGKPIVEMPVYPVPDEKKGVLGVHITPTVSGNLMLGPSAEFLDEKTDYSNQEQIMKKLTEEGLNLLPQIKDDISGTNGVHIIRSFAGIRPKLSDKNNKTITDFIIEASNTVKGFIYLLGIESPGITASVPIAKHVKKIVEELKGEMLACKDEFCERDNMFKPYHYKKELEQRTQPEIKSACNCNQLSDEAVLIKSEGQKMVCRCELVTEKEILEAFDNIVNIGGIPTFKGIKNRTRASMGNCQGSFCTVDITELLRRERNFDILKLTYDGNGSEMYIGRLRG